MSSLTRDLDADRCRPAKADVGNSRSSDFWYSPIAEDSPALGVGRSNDTAIAADVHMQAGGDLNVRAVGDRRAVCSV